MFVNILKSKIHRPVVTDAKIHYMGSITIDKKLMQHAGLLPFEKVLVVSIDNGERIETYVIEGREGSGEICINGAAARKISKGSRVIIMSFIYIEGKEAINHKPKIVYVNSKNEIVSEEDHVKRNDQC